MFDLFPQQNFCDLLKSTVYQSRWRHGKTAGLQAIKALENARVWQPALFAEAIDQVWPGAIWIDDHDAVHIVGGPATLTVIVDAYLKLTGEQVGEVL